MTVTPTRRDRLRAATISEIKERARRYLLDAGPAGISRRAIARDMGMTAPALAHYFPSPDTLLVALTTDAYEDLRAAIEQARDAVPGSDPAGRFAAAARAFRRWALDHPEEFRLAFGQPLPTPQERRRAADPVDPKDVARRTHQDCGDAGLRFGAVFTRLVAQLWAGPGFPTPPADDLDPEVRDQLEPLAEEINRSLPEAEHLPLTAVYVFLRAWTRLYGLVVVEAFGHQSWALGNPEPLFEAELDSILRTLAP